MLDSSLESTSFLEKFKERFIMSLVDKHSNVLDDKKEVVVTTPLSERKLLTTEKVTKSDEVHKRTENFTTSEEVLEGTDEFHKHTENITTNKYVDKGTEKLEDIKQAVVKIRRKIQIIFRVSLKDLQDG